MLILIQVSGPHAIHYAPSKVTAVGIRSDDLGTQRILNLTTKEEATVNNPIASIGAINPKLSAIKPVNIAPMA